MAALDLEAPLVAFWRHLAPVRTMDTHSHQLYRQRVPSWQRCVLLLKHLPLPVLVHVDVVPCIHFCVSFVIHPALFAAQAPRFSVTAPPQVPGPGQYDAGVGLLKKSYNMAIVEEEERALGRRR